MAKKYNSSRDDMSPMLRSDKSAFANMPQTSFVKAYPMQPGFFDGSYNDSLSGIDSLTSKGAAIRNGQKQKDRY